MSNKGNQPHFPTFPVQDQFGRTIFSMGASMTQQGAFIIAAGLCHHADSLDTETIADMAIEIANHIIEKTFQQIEDDKQPTGIIQQ
jgi:hypothetical protein